MAIYRKFGRAGLLASGGFFAAALHHLIALPLTVPAAAEVVVGRSRVGAVTKPPPASIGELKAKYHRPVTIPFPADNTYTPSKAALGKKLYFDSRLSAANLLSCASCHNPAYAFADGQAKGVGHNMKQLGRRSPSIVNAAYGQIFMWDGRAASLEEQALGPIKTNVEMNLPLDQMIARLSAIAGYRPLFQAVFPGEDISEATVAKAIATYERTVVSGQAPFDAWIAGNETAISESAQRGFVLFNTKAQCASCHSGWNFTDDSFHDIGLSDSDVGRGKFLPGVVKMQHAFKTPGLREIAYRGPYMHNGSIATLDGVIDQYDKGGVDRPSRSDLVKPLGLTALEKTDLVSFLQTLSSDFAPTTVPLLPR